MEQIKQALIKAKVTQGKEGLTARAKPASPRPPVIEAAWTPKRVQLDPRHLERHRLISFEGRDQSALAFNVLRTKINRVLKENGWTSVAVTSPTPGCGKTMVALNLSFSLARQTEFRTVLVDLDLKRPTVASSLGVVADSSIGEYLEGRGDLQQCFVQITDNLIVGCNNHGIKHSSELMTHDKLAELLRRVREALNPRVILFDLPPMLSGDEVIAFLPQVDCSLLVIASRLTKAQEVDACDRQASALNNYLGVVLNKSVASNEYYY